MVCCSRETGSTLLCLYALQAPDANTVQAIVVYPTTPDEVQLVVELVTTKSNLRLAVCGGRHSTSGSSSTDGGVCIDLRKMNRIKVDPEEGTVTAEGGCLWSEVDRAAEKYRLAVVGGTVYVFRGERLSLQDFLRFAPKTMATFPTTACLDQVLTQSQQYHRHWRSHSRWRLRSK